MMAKGWDSRPCAPARSFEFYGGGPALDFANFRGHDTSTLQFSYMQLFGSVKVMGGDDEGCLQWIDAWLHAVDDKAAAHPLLCLKGCGVRHAKFKGWHEASDSRGGRYTE